MVQTFRIPNILNVMPMDAGPDSYSYKPAPDCRKADYFIVRQLGVVLAR